MKPLLGQRRRRGPRRPPAAAGRDPLARRRRPTRSRARARAAAARELAAYWRDGYDWRAAEAAERLRAVRRRTACTASPRATGRRCCSCTAGRAACGSSTRSSRCCASTRGSIVPSLPGYGFSFTPGGGARRSSRCADALHALMGSLGHERYLVAGGDWGASIAVPAGATPTPTPSRRCTCTCCRCAGPRPGRSPSSPSRAALERWIAGGGRLRAHPGHAAADARLRAAATRPSG